VVSFRSCGRDQHVSWSSEAKLKRPGMTRQQRQLQQTLKVKRCVQFMYLCDKNERRTQLLAALHTLNHPSHGPCTIAKIVIPVKRGRLIGGEDSDDQRQQVMEKKAANPEYDGDVRNVSRRPRPRTCSFFTLS
jgi:hypothetical protein